MRGYAARGYRQSQRRVGSSERLKGGGLREGAWRCGGRTLGSQCRRSRPPGWPGGGHRPPVPCPAGPPPPRGGCTCPAWPPRGDRAGSEVTPVKSHQCCFDSAEVRSARALGRCCGRPLGCQCVERGRLAGWARVTGLRCPARPALPPRGGVRSPPGRRWAAGRAPNCIRLKASRASGFVMITLGVVRKFVLKLFSQAEEKTHDGV